MLSLMKHEPLCPVFAIPAMDKEADNDEHDSDDGDGDGPSVLQIDGQGVGAHLGVDGIGDFNLSDQSTHPGSSP
jgi:hypothetical protein